MRLLIFLLSKSRRIVTECILLLCVNALLVLPLRKQYCLLKPAKTSLETVHSCRRPIKWSAETVNSRLFLCDVTKYTSKDNMTRYSVDVHIYEGTKFFNFAHPQIFTHGCRYLLLRIIDERAWYRQTCSCCVNLQQQQQQRYFQTTVYSLKNAMYFGAAAKRWLGIYECTV